MTNLLTKTVACAGFLLMAGVASAQYPSRPTYPNQVQDQREAQDQDRLFDRVRTDLDRVMSSTLPYSVDRSRVSTAEEQILACQRMVDDGTYDRRTFDQTISAVQRVVDLNRLNDQTRGFLSDDIHELSRMQARLEGY